MIKDFIKTVLVGMLVISLIGAALLGSAYLISTYAQPWMMLILGAWPVGAIVLDQRRCKI